MQRAVRQRTVSGLGIDLCVSSQPHVTEGSTLWSIDSLNTLNSLLDHVSHAQQAHGASNSRGAPPAAAGLFGAGGALTSALPTSRSAVIMRSSRGMEGLVEAERGGSMVVLGAPSRVHEGQRISPANIIRIPPAPPALKHGRSVSTGGGLAVARQGTILSAYSTPARTSAELRSLLGDARARVKAGATVASDAGGRAPTLKKSRSMPDLARAAPLALEQAKAGGPRVEVDILLASDTCVEGGVLSGALEVCVRQPTSDEGAVLLGEAKIRIVGIETIPHHDRHIFFQTSFDLASISTEAHRLYTSAPDADRFCRARTGIHQVRFQLRAPRHMGPQGAKGVFSYKNGITVQYIAMASIKVKDVQTGTQSIAHFYRPVELWPSFNPQLVLAKAPRPIEASGEGTVFMGGAGKLKLSASLYREVWVAGQRCLVKVAIDNGTKKPVNKVHLALQMLITVFRPNAELEAASPRAIRFESDPDACQTTTIRKTVAETSLEMGARGGKGVVSARGWWPGCPAGERNEFMHFIVIPPDALSIPRSKLVEVAYELRVSASAGQLASDVQTRVPLRIINQLSVDPPLPLLEPDRSIAVLEIGPEAQTQAQAGQPALVGGQCQIPTSTSPARPAMPHRATVPIPSERRPSSRHEESRIGSATGEFALGPASQLRGRVPSGHQRAASSVPAGVPPPVSMNGGRRSAASLPPSARLPAPDTRPIFARPTGHALLKPSRPLLKNVDARRTVPIPSESDSDSRARLGAHMLALRYSDAGMEDRITAAGAERTHKRAPSAPGPVAPHRFFAGANEPRAGMSRSVSSSPTKARMPGAAPPEGQWMARQRQPSAPRLAAQSVFLSPARSSTPTGSGMAMQWRYQFGPRRANRDPMWDATIRQHDESPSRRAPLPREFKPEQTPGNTTSATIEPDETCTEDDASDGKYGSETEHSDYSESKTGEKTTIASLRYGTLTQRRRGRPLHSSESTESSSGSMRHELGFQSSASDDEEDADTSAMNTLENRASRAMRNRVSAVEFNAPLLRSSTSGRNLL